MSTENSLVSFDRLATEILFEIFAYLSYNDTAYAFSDLNQRFADVLSQYRRFLKVFTTPTRDFTFWQTILPTISSRIEQLIITTTEFPLSLDLFSNLKSLVIDSSLAIDWNELVSLLDSEQFKNLNSLKVKSEIVQKDGDHAMSILHDILSQKTNSLRVFESLCELSISYEIMNRMEMNTNLRSLSLKALNFTCVLPLFHNTPNLKYLNLSLKDFGLNDPRTPRESLSNIQLKKCVICIDSGLINSRSFPLFAWFIKQFSSSLIELSLDLHQVMVDIIQFTGLVLQEQFLESMQQLKSLHFYARLRTKPENRERFLSTFQTSFWFDHHWTVAMHDPYLYTLPFHFDAFHNFFDFDQIESSNEAVLNSPHAWSHIKSIEFAESFDFSSNLIEPLQIKMPKLTSTSFTPHLSFHLVSKIAPINPINRKLNSITTVHCATNWLQSLKNWFDCVMPNIRYLFLSHSSASRVRSSDRMVLSQKFDEYLSDEYAITGSRCYSLKIQYVDIKVNLNETDGIYQQVIELLKELLEMSGSLQIITFHFYHLPRFPLILPYTNLHKTIELFKRGKLSEKYRIKHVQNYMHFVRKI